MKDKKALLEKRIQAKKKKPAFVRSDHHKRKRLEDGWRRPKGWHNKQRLKKKGHVKNPGSGYRTPKEVRGVHSSGLIPMIVCSLHQLDSITKENGIILSSKLGDKKRKQIIEEIKKRGMHLLNLDADKTIAGIESKIKERHQARKKKAEQLKEKKKGIEEKVKKTEPKKTEEQKPAEEKKEQTDEEKKKLEKQEKDKLLTKRT